MLTKGRICYIEPTTDVGENKGSGYVGPLEDYDIAVDLKIIKGNRYACGVGNQSGESNIMEFSSEKGTINFIGGTNGYMGTNFTEVSMKDTGGNSDECLGIKEIKIDYNTWTYPQVTIVFTDIRGISLIGKEEQYVDGNSNEPSFFKDLFRFPYPLFRMSIKGYYGNTVTYDLALQDTSITFDSQVGNFDVRARFIGYSYGAYSDMPMTYLAAAPFMSYKGKKYWDEQVATGKFVFSDGTPMITFPELRKRVAEALSNEAFMRQTNDWTTQVGQLDGQKRLLEKLVQEYPFRDWIEPAGKTFIMHTAPMGYRLSMSDIQGKIYAFYKDLLTWRKEYRTSATDDFGTFLSPILKYKEKNYTENIIKEIIVPAGETLDEVEWAEIYDSNVSKDEISKYGNDGFYFYYIDKGNDTYINECYAFREKIKDINRNIEKVNEDYRNVERGSLTKLLKFTPSIRNIYNLVFAHYETFARAYYDCMSNIKTQLDERDSLRLAETYGVSINDTDISEFANSHFMPPFTGFFNDRTLGSSNNREAVWPGELLGGSNLEEVAFVDSLIDASKLYSTQQAQMEAIMNASGSNINADIYDFIPLTSYDYRYNGTIGNPYRTVKELSDNGKDIAVQTLITLFLRSYYFICQFEGARHQEKAIGYIEALNFYKAMGHNVGESVYNTISRLGKNSMSSMRSVMFGTDRDASVEWNVGTNLPICRDFGKHFYYNWITDNNEIYLPIGTFSLNDIKKDVSMGEYKSNHKYLCIKDYKSTPDSFGISESRRYFRDVIDNISAINFGEFSDILTGATESVKKIMDREYNPSYTGVSYNKNAIVFSSTTLEQALVDGDYNGVSVVFPSYIDEDRFQSLYGHPFYFLQNNIEDRKERLIAKAYLFLFSIPLRGNAGNYGIVKKCENGTELFVRLLREGAVYWRSEYLKNNDGKDIVLTTGTVNDKVVSYKQADSDQVYCSKGLGYETLNPLPKNSLRNYGKIDIPEGVTESRMSVLKSRFEDWAVNEFADIDELLNDEDVYVPYKISVNDLHYVVDEKTGNIRWMELDYQQAFRDATDIRTKKQIRIQRLLKDLFFDVKSVVDVTDGFDGDNPYMTTERFGNVYRWFFDALGKIYRQEQEPEREKSLKDKIEESFGSMDVRLSAYMTLKNLYDRWFCTSSFSRWDYSDEYSDFNRFIYIDSYYNDIGDRLLLNATQISDMLSKFLPGGTNTNDNISVYNFLSAVASSVHGGLVTLPVFYGDAVPEEIEKIFSVFSTATNKYHNQSSFVFLYQYTMSKNLDIDDGYSDDSFDYDRDVPPCLSNSDGMTVPCFGVSYANPQQCFFTNVKLTTEAPRITDWSIQAQFNIGANAGRNPRETTLYGQDIYSIYSQNAYECSVEMMGDAQILPLMYFQLNGIPMWHGMYQIQGVSHEIYNNSMSTRFWGTRMSKISIPMTDDIVMTDNIPNFSVASNTRIGTIGMEKNYSVMSYTEKGPAYDVWNHVFNVLRLGSNKLCSRYTYQMAAGFVGKDVVYGSGVNCTRANGNANQSSYWQSLISLGYQKVFDKILDTPSADMKTQVDALDCKPGDVVVYYATEHNYSTPPNAYKFGHTQFYVNDDIKWASSVKYNYSNNAPGLSFVYGRQDGCSKWRLIHFKSPEAGSLKS